MKIYEKQKKRWLSLVLMYVCVCVCICVCVFIYVRWCLTRHWGKVKGEGQNSSCHGDLKLLSPPPDNKLGA